MHTSNTKTIGKDFYLDRRKPAGKTVLQNEVEAYFWNYLKNIINLLYL